MLLVWILFMVCTISRGTSVCLTSAYKNPRVCKGFFVEARYSYFSSFAITLPCLLRSISSSCSLPSISFAFMYHTYLQVLRICLQNHLCHALTCFLTRTVEGVTGSFSRSADSLIWAVITVARSSLFIWISPIVLVLYLVQNTRFPCSLDKWQFSSVRLLR